MVSLTDRPFHVAHVEPAVDGAQDPVGTVAVTAVLRGQEARVRLDLLQEGARLFDGSIELLLFLVRQIRPHLLQVHQRLLAAADDLLVGATLREPCHPLLVPGLPVREVLHIQDVVGERVLTVIARDDNHLLLGRLAALAAGEFAAQGLAAAYRQNKDQDQDAAPQNGHALVHHAPPSSENPFY